MGGRLPPHRKFHAPHSALAADELPRADALYRVARQLAFSYALIACVRAMVGELEIKVGKAMLAPVRLQVGGIGGEYVQKEPSVGVA